MVWLYSLTLVCLHLLALIPWEYFLKSPLGIFTESILPCWSDFRFSKIEKVLYFKETEYLYPLPDIWPAYSWGHSDWPGCDLPLLKLGKASKAPQFNKHLFGSLFCARLSLPLGIQKQITWFSPVGIISGLSGMTREEQKSDLSWWTVGEVSLELGFQEWVWGGKTYQETVSLPSQFSRMSLHMVLRDLSIYPGVGEGWATHKRLSMPVSGPLLSPPTPLDCKVFQAKTGLILCVPPASDLLPGPAT